jgi:hypothetical protein
MKKLAIAALLFALPSAATAEWTFVDTTIDNEDIFIRDEDWLAGRSHHRDARVWVRIDHSRNRKTPYRYTMMLVSINCPAETYRFLHGTAFMPNGRSTSERVSTTSEYAVPGTIAAEIVEMTCFDPTPTPTPTPPPTPTPNRQRTI